MDIGKSIKFALVERGMTQTGLASIFGVRVQQVNHWANSGRVTLDRLASLADAFDMSVSEFIALGEKKNPVTYVKRGK